MKKVIAPGTLSVREELKAHLEARRELGPEMDDLLVASFLEKIDREIDSRIEAKLAQRTRALQSDRRGATITLIVTLALAIPLSAVAAWTAGLPGLAIVWAALLFLNLYRR